MSKRRRPATGDENKFAALLRTLRDEDSVVDPVDTADGDRSIDAETIDVEAETVLDRAALPASSVALPTNPSRLITPPQSIDPIEIATLGGEAVGADAESIEPKPVDVETVEVETVDVEPEPVDVEPEPVDDDTTENFETLEDSTPSTESDAPRTPGRPGRPRRKFPKPKNPNNGKRGRPATGKRSNIDWYGRTFYIRKQTDDQLEEALFQLKRSGTEIDKSDLVDALLAAWSEVTLGVIPDFQIGKTVKNQLKK